MLLANKIRGNYVVIYSQNKSGLSNQRQMGQGGQHQEQQVTLSMKRQILGSVILLHGSCDR